MTSSSKLAVAIAEKSDCVNRVTTVTHSTDKFNFDYYGRKLFINLIEILVCFSFIHDQVMWCV